jgi:hypothetical protein
MHGQPPGQGGGRPPPFVFNPFGVGEDALRAAMNKALGHIFDGSLREAAEAMLYLTGWQGTVDEWLAHTARRRQEWDRGRQPEPGAAWGWTPPAPPPGPEDAKTGEGT